MQIKRLVIENFKSIERIELIEPNPFTVFVGPNGSGKSTIFEALEFHIPNTDLYEKLRLFGGRSTLQNRLIYNSTHFGFAIGSDTFVKGRNSSYLSLEELDSNKLLFELGLATSHDFDHESNERKYIEFARSFSRVFVNNLKLQRQNYSDDSRLALSASNLEKVLRRVLSDEALKTEIFEWLDLFIPGFKAVEVDDRNELHWFEESIPDYFTKDLISDGTYNILALLTAVYQSDDKPQFLCIEEPENGLHPQVAGELIDFFRIMCEERGHYIWLNTHSKSMAERVRPEEFVVVDKKNGATQVQQFHKEDFFGMRADEAWLTNSLNGGLAW